MLAGFADLAVRQLERRAALHRQLASSRRRAPRRLCTCGGACKFSNVLGSAKVFRWPCAWYNVCLPQGLMTAYAAARIQRQEQVAGAVAWAANLLSRQFAVSGLSLPTRAECTGRLSSRQLLGAVASQCIVPDDVLCRHSVCMCESRLPQYGYCWCRLLRTLSCFTKGILLVDTRMPEWPILHANEAWAEQNGVRLALSDQNRWWVRLSCGMMCLCFLPYTSTVRVPWTGFVPLCGDGSQ